VDFKRRREGLGIVEVLVSVALVAASVGPLVAVACHERRATARLEGELIASYVVGGFLEEGSVPTKGSPRAFASRSLERFRWVAVTLGADGGKARSGPLVSRRVEQAASGGWTIRVRATSLAPSLPVEGEVTRS
jgi:hypothetical protein